MNNKHQYELGMIGLGVMGCNMLLNMSDHGFSVAGYDKDPSKVEALRKVSSDRDICGTKDIKVFIAQLRKPRVVMMLVPAGAPVDSVIQDLLPLLEKGDIIIDGGNSHYKDTDLRTQKLAKKGIQFLGVGVSGGEEGARHGPSIMPGGRKDAYERIRPVFEAIAAKADGTPCVAYLGSGSAGHFVKMVHNGIEYGLMQLIGETYGIMKEGLGLQDEEIQKVYSEWNKNELNSYLIEITANIFNKFDEKSGKLLVDVILDVAKQKGTGMWTSQSAMELQVPIPTIDIAVEMRDLSMLEDQRKQCSKLYERIIKPYTGNRETFIEQLRNALYVSFILTYAQGLAVLSTASEKFNYNIDLEVVARIWRGGCIIRAALLENIRQAYQKDPKLCNLILDADISKRIIANEEALRHVVCASAEMGLPAPGLMTSLSYIDGYRSAWLPANLIQAQRDYFGSHTYERVDAKGIFHTEWE